MKIWLLIIEDDEGAYAWPFSSKELAQADEVCESVTWTQSPHNEEFFDGKGKDGSSYTLFSTILDTGSGEQQGV